MTQQSEHGAPTDRQREVPHRHLARAEGRPRAAAQGSGRLVNLPQVGDGQHWLDVGSSSEQINLGEFFLNKQIQKEFIFYPPAGLLISWSP